jgi:predicted Rdx family selenoprotein
LGVLQFVSFFNSQSNFFQPATPSDLSSQFAQELLSTFSTSLGEVALQPATGGIFVVKLYYAPPSADGGQVMIQEHLLWDRKAEGGFPGKLNFLVSFSLNFHIIFGEPILGSTLGCYVKHQTLEATLSTRPFPAPLILLVLLYSPKPTSHIYKSSRTSPSLQPQKRKSSKSAYGTSSTPPVISGM